MIGVLLNNTGPMRGILASGPSGKGWILPSVRLSDHASFWDQGFIAVMVTDSAFFRNPHYHLPSDTMDTLDYNFMAELVESLVLFLITPITSPRLGR